MKKWIPAGMLLAIGVCFVVTGCSGKPGNGKLTLEDGQLSWKKATSASYYEIDMGSGGKKTNDTSYDLAAKCELEGKMSVTVSSVSKEDEKTEIGTIQVDAEKLKEPIIRVEQNRDKLCFAWKTVENARSYTYDLHDGKGLQTAKADAEGMYSIPIVNEEKQTIRVVANGSSKDNVLYLSSESTMQYQSDSTFDPALMAKHPAVYVSKGLWIDSYELGTVLSKGIYDAEISYYVMDANGRTVTGNGLWGRRITDAVGTNFWLCETNVDVFESAGTIPSANTLVRQEMKVTVDKCGNLLLNVYDFGVDEQVVFSDVVCNGKSVLNEKGGLANPSKEVQKFDITKTGQYLKTWVSAGTWYQDSPQDSTITLPINLPDGTHPIEVSYYVCDQTGDILSGNGMWGRRFAVDFEDAASYVWLNEFDIEKANKGMDIPEPAKLQTTTFMVNVKNGKCNILALDFNKGEMVIISKVSAVKIPSGNGVFVSDGKGIEDFRVLTTLGGGKRLSDVTLEVTYTVSDIFGNAITGNGAWGRRIMDASGDECWLCEASVEGHKDAAKTLPKAGQFVTKTFKVAEINKKGAFTLKMHDFKALEMLKITSIKYNGTEVLAK